MDQETVLCCSSRSEIGPLSSISNNIGTLFPTHCTTASKRLLVVLLLLKIDATLILPLLACTRSNSAKRSRNLATSSKRKVYRHVIGAPIPDLKGAMIAIACALGPVVHPPH